MSLWRMGLVQHPQRPRRRHDRRDQFAGRFDAWLAGDCERHCGEQGRGTPMSSTLRVVIADDERPARSFLAAVLRDFEDVALVGEAETGAAAIELIEREPPDL